MLGEKLIPSMANLDLHGLFDDYTEKHLGAPGRRYADDLAYVASAAVQASVELTWPIVRKLGLHLRDVGPLVHDGWHFRAVDTGMHHSLSFVAEHEDEPGGWFYNCAISMKMTPEGEAALRAADEAMVVEFAEAQAKLPVADRKPVHRFSTSFMDDSPEKVAVKADPANFIHQDECPHVQKFAVCPYYRNGMPPIYSGYSRDGLESILKEDYANGWVSARTVDVRPSIYLQHGINQKPHMPTSTVVGDIPTSLVGMKVLGFGIQAADMVADVNARIKDLSEMQYVYFGSERGGVIDALGVAAAVQDLGLVEDSVHDLAVDLWKAAAAADATHAAVDFNIVLRLLREHGHTTCDDEFECNDAEDYSFVEEIDEGRGILWLRTQHGQYRIDFIEDANGGPLRRMMISAQHDPSLEYGGEDIVDFEYSLDGSHQIDSGQEGFLAVLEWDDERIAYEVTEVGSFEGRTIRDLNGVLGKIGSVSCILEGEYEVENDEDDASSSIAP